MTNTADITAMLDAIASGERDSDELFAVVYAELRQIAKANRYRWHGDETMNTTALIHEAYLKLAGQARSDWRNRGHFFATAAKAMRQVLVNYAKRRQTAKRGGNVNSVPLEDDLAIDHETALELLIVDQALEALEADSQRACRVFECRVFGGLSQDETADALDISRSTVKRDWLYASAFVHRAVDDPTTD